MKKLLRTTALLATAGVFAMIATGCAATSPEGGLICTVEDKDRTTEVVDGVSKSVYRVYTDCGVFNVEDAPFLGKFNSADTYNELEPGKTYILTTYGHRNGFLSWFPNITEAKEVGE